MGLWRKFIEIPITRGSHVFTTVWAGQLVSAVGTGLTNFALGVWVFQRTGSATQFALIAFFSGIASAVTLPLSGTLIDRWDRRRTLIIANTGAALVTIAAAALLFMGRLEVWHVYVGVAARSIFSSLLFPALSASTSLLLPKQHFGRASGMMQANAAAAQIISPLLGGFLIVALTLQGIFFLDFISYLAALASLLFVRIPAPVKTRNDSEPPSLARETTAGVRYIADRPGLLALLIYFAAVNLVLGGTNVLFTPMILSFASTKALGTILSALGVGFLCGSLVMSVWGGPQRRVSGVLGFGALFGLFTVVVGLRPSIALIALGAFGMYFFLPIVNGCSQAIWLAKTPPELQGRVFAIRRIIGASTVPLSYLIAGPLAERVFEPMAANRSFGSISALIGQGPGRGIGMMFIIAGLLIVLAQVLGYLYAPLRRVEDDLPDAPINVAFSRV